MTLLSEQLALVNPALRLMGESSLSSLNTASTDDTEALIADMLNIWIEEVLSELPWSCVKKEDKSLTSYTNANKIKYDYAFLLPADWVRMVGEPWYSGAPILYTNKDMWEIVGTDTSTGQLIIETMLGSPQIQYVYKALSTEAYFTYLDGTLKETIIKKLKMDLCISITENERLSQQYIAEYNLQLRKARSRNRGERWPKKTFEESIISVRTFST